MLGCRPLPQISFNLFIPTDEQKPTVSINSFDQSTQILDKKVYPKQMYWSRERSLSERPFVINSDYYSSTGIEKPLVNISEPFVIGGVSGVMVTVFPFSYNPKDDKLSIINSATFEINFNAEFESPVNKSEAYNEFLRNVLVGYEPTESLLSMRYLIITAPTFEAGLASFINHKSAQGFTVDVFNTTTTGTTTTAIKTFIQARYDNAATRPEFVLLVGDVQHIPYWVGGGEGTPSTDLNYVQLAGTDKFADAFIGRFSVTTSTRTSECTYKIHLYGKLYCNTCKEKYFYGFY